MAAGPSCRFGRMILRPAEFELHDGPRRVSLTPTAFRLLCVLVERAGRLVDKRELLASVWPDTFVEEANLSVHIAAIRRALGPAPSGGQYIETVPTRGYRFVEAVEPLATSPSAVDEEPVAPAPVAVRLAVLPLVVLRPDPETDFLAFSLPNAIATTLANHPSVSVRSPLAASGRHDTTHEPGAGRTRDGFALAGTLMRRGDDLHITLQLLMLPDATVQWSEAWTSSLEGVADVERQVVPRLLRALVPEAPLDGPFWRTSDLSMPSGHGYVFYLRANQLAYEASQWRHASALYEECLERDPGFAPAWAGLGRCQRLMSKFGWRERETPDNSVRPYVGSLRALLEGHRSEALDLLEQAVASPLDGEALYYLVRSFARLEEYGRALELMASVIDKGFLCHETFARDPWMAPLRRSDAFRALVDVARRASDDARAAFRAGQGPVRLRRRSA